MRALHEELEGIETMVNSVPNPQKEIEILQTRLQRLKEKAIDKEQIPRIIQQLSQETAKLDIEVTSIKPREDIKDLFSNLPEGVSKVYIEVKIRCPYQILVKYLEALNSLPLLFTVEDLSIEKFKAGVTESLDVLLLLSAYVMA